MEVRLTPRTWPIWATVSARSSLSVRAVRRWSAPSLERRPPDRPRARAAASPAIVRSRMISRSIMWTGGCRQGDVAVSRAVLKWRSRRHADQLEAPAETDRRLDWERRSAAVQAAARERDRQLLGQEHAVEILGSTPLPPRSDWHQLRVHELLVSDPTDVLH